MPRTLPPQDEGARGISSASHSLRLRLYSGHAPVGQEYQYGQYPTRSVEETGATAPDLAGAALAAAAVPETRKAEIISTEAKRFMANIL